MKISLSQTLQAAVGAAALLATPISVLDALAAAPPAQGGASQAAPEVKFETLGGKTIKLLKKGQTWSMTDQELFDLLKSTDGTLELKNGAKIKFSKGVVIGTEGPLLPQNNAAFSLGPHPEKPKATP